MCMCVRVCVCVWLGIKPKVSCIVGKQCTTELHLSPVIVFLSKLKPHKKYWLSWYSPSRSIKSVALDQRLQLTMFFLNSALLWEGRPIHFFTVILAKDMYLTIPGYLFMIYIVLVSRMYLNVPFLFIKWQYSANIS